MYRMLDPDTVLRQRAAEIDRELAARRHRPRKPAPRDPERSATTRLFDWLRPG